MDNWRNFFFSNSSHFEWRVGLSDTILKGNHPRTIPAKFALICFSGFREEDFNEIFYQNMPNLHNRYKSAERKISQKKTEYTVLPRSIAPCFIANLAYRQNSRLSRFPPFKIPRYTAKLSYRHPPQVFRHKNRKTNLNSPVSTAHNYPLTAVY